MAQVVKVTHIDQSQNGKDRVYFDGKNGWQDAYYVSQGLRMPAIGDVIEVQTSSKSFGRDKPPTWFLNDWKPARASNGGAYPSPSQGAAPAANPPISAPTKGWEVAPMNLCAFVSNVVANAIQAGLIKEPVDIHRWTKSAYGAAESLRHGFDLQETDRPDPAERQDRDDDFDNGRDIPF